MKKLASWLCTLGLASSLWVGCDNETPTEVTPPEETAEFTLTFAATWSPVTHPVEFPSLPHFSGLVGATHGSSYDMWGAGGLATPGIKDMAETGSKAALMGEVEVAILAGIAGTVVSGGGVGLSPGTVSMSFEAGSNFPLLSITSMIAPSPDWFVGVAGLDLRPGGQWIDSVEVVLEPYDAGTDSGPSYQSPDAATVPQAPIGLLTEGPFAGNPPPVGTFTIVRR